MAGLSEKAKGKQRAVDPPTQNATNPPSISQRELTVRFTDGVLDLFLTVGKKDSVGDVKKLIRKSRPQLAKRRLRLIHAGRLLTDGIFLFDWLVSLEERQRRAVGDGGAELAKGTDGSGNPTAPAAPGPTWLHCSVGAEMTDGEVELDDGKTQASQIKPLRGFDRLAAAGFSEEDIATFRRTFHSQASGDYLDSEEPGEDEDQDEHARALEEQWIDSLDNASTASISQSSASSTILQGLLVGFFFPLLPFFFLYEVRPAVFWEDGREQERVYSAVFSRRMQVALVLGFMINVTIGIWRYLLGP